MIVTLTVLATMGLALAVLYAVVTSVNLSVFRAPGDGNALSRRQAVCVSILIPARDEAVNMPGAIAAALAQTGVSVDVVVLDDGSTDATPQIVQDCAASDPRVRLIKGAPLPAGWNGKQHACHQLSQHAGADTWLFLDADVRLAPDAAARMHAHMCRHDLGFVSGFPRQITGTFAEALVIAQIMVVLLGYLPLWLARRSPAPGFAAGCGQLMMVRADAYAAAGGHAAFHHLMHDGLNLPRNIRGTGGRTDIIDATPLAACRMYDSWSGIWSGFTKNATEGMATPGALPVWTILLAGGHVLPWVLLPFAWAFGASAALVLSLLAIAAVYAARGMLAMRMRQPAVSVLLHPIGILVTLAIQWAALWGAARGKRTTWRGRSYDFN